MNNFGNRLKKILEHKNITQKELAELSETTGATISRYINENRTPNAELIVKIATALNVTVDYLLGITDDPNSTTNQVVIETRDDLKDSRPPRPLTENIIKRFQDLRISKNLSFEEVAKKLKYPERTIRQWELGTLAPDTRELVKIADFFGVSTDYLLSRSNFPYKVEDTLKTFGVSDFVLDRLNDEIMAGILKISKKLRGF